MNGMRISARGIMIALAALGVAAIVGWWIYGAVLVVNGMHSKATGFVVVVVGLIASVFIVGGIVGGVLILWDSNPSFTIGGKPKIPKAEVVEEATRDP